MDFVVTPFDSMRPPHESQLLSACCTCRGNTIVEFTLVGIPLIFVLISIAEISRAMWAYTTVAHAVREGTRFAIVHGHNCEVAPNTCAGYATIGWIARRIRQGGVGLVEGIVKDGDEIAVADDLGALDGLHLGEDLANFGRPCRRWGGGSGPVGSPRSQRSMSYW